MTCTVLERRSIVLPSGDVLTVPRPASSAARTLSAVPTEPSVVAPAALPAETVARTRTVPWSALLVVAMTVAVTWWAVDHAATLSAATSVLSGLDLGWVLLAGAAAAATWVFSGVSQQGALASSVPFGRLLATQFAGTFANQFTPAGLGGGAVNVRFLRRRGITAGEALAAVGLTQIAGVVVHLALLLAVLATDPALAGSLPSGQVPLWLRIAVAAVVLAASVVVALRRQWVVDRARQLWGQTVAAVSHLRRPRRVAQLLLGSAGLTVAHVLVLFGTLRALGTTPSLIGVAAAYLLATTAAAVVPTPGGIGSLDASLALFLYGSGVITSSAIAAVLVYRLLTSWLALAPSAATLNVLVRRGIV
jgi:uncharacterized membrane protein YbhN (UPF0104 family)